MAESTQPAPTPFERFRNFVSAVVSVPKSEIDRREAEYKKHRAAKKRAQAKS